VTILIPEGGGWWREVGVVDRATMGISTIPLYG
jgi:hypothetical protein